MSESQETLNEVRSVRNNNPGNLRAADAETQRRLTQPGYVLDKATGFDKDGFAIFPDKETGLTAMQRQINIDASRGMTGGDMIRKYAPKNDNTPLGQKYPNDPDVYVNNVFTKSGLDPNKPIDPKDIDTIQRGMVKQEGGQGAYDHFYSGKTGSTQYAAAAPAAASTTTNDSSIVPAFVAKVGTVAAGAGLAGLGLANFTSSNTAPVANFDSERSSIGTLSQWSDPRALYSNTRSKLRNKPIHEPVVQSSLSAPSSAEATQKIKIKIAQKRLKDAAAKSEKKSSKKRIPMVARLKRIDNKMQRVMVPHMAENAIRFKDLRNKIQEQIILNDQSEKE